VVADLLAKAKKGGRNAAVNLILFRLAATFGLRRKEIVSLRMGDVMMVGPRPFIEVRACNTKGKKKTRTSRRIPAWWDSQTYCDLLAWAKRRVAMGAGLGDPFFCTITATGRAGRPLSLQQAARRWRTALRILGPARRRQLHLHCGRHTAASHALAAGHTVMEVLQMLGHRNLSTTLQYLHLLEAPDCRDLFPLKPEG